MRDDVQSKQPSGRLRIPVVWVLCIATTALFAGGGIGWWLGHSSALPDQLAMAAVLAKVAPGALGGDDPSQPGADSPDWSSLALQLALRLNSLEALLEELEGRGAEPMEFMRGAIAQLSDSDLEFVLRTAVRLNADDLAEVGDVQGFAYRLSEIALDGIVEADEPDAEQADFVYFTRAPERNDPAAVGRHSFGRDEHRIYAVFPRGGYDLEQVMVKWFRTDKPEILLFGRYAIAQNQEYSWVWLEKREGWDQGHYQVDVFSGDEAMTPIARGQFTVE
jgi:hypothetical protein